MRKFAVFFEDKDKNKLDNQNLINITHSLHSNKIHYFFIQNFLKTFVHGIFADHVCAINPFIKRFPNEDLKKIFLEKLVNEIISPNGDVPFNINNQEDDIILKYYLLVAYVQKPSLST